MDASMMKGVIFRNMFHILGQCHVGRNCALQYKVLYLVIPLGLSRGKKHGFRAHKHQIVMYP